MATGIAKKNPLTLLCENGSAGDRLITSDSLIAKDSLMTPTRHFLPSLWLMLTLLCCWSISTQSLAATEEADSSNTSHLGVTILKEGEQHLNNIPLLDNRFRIDHNVDQVTLLFFRKRGSPPVILVKPDGSKLYATQGVTGIVDWFDDATYDLIRIKNPMPGPWQAVGKIDPNSKILIISDIELHVEDLPEILIQGETIKLTAKLTNGGEPINARDFNEIVRLNVDFASTNNSEYNNFGADPVAVTQFVDDGRNYDERPKDGVFTGEFKLGFAAGEWIPKYYVETPLFSREIIHDPVIVEPSPIKMTVETTDIQEEYHRLIIDIEGDYVNKSKMIFQGKVHYPNEDIQSFSIVEEVETTREFKIMNYDYGTYRVEISAFGENTNGREIMLDLQDVVFNVQPPIEDINGAGELNTEEANELLRKKLEEEDRLKRIAEEERRKKEQQETAVWVIVIGNIVLLLSGAIAVRVLVLKKPLLPSFLRDFSWLKKLNPKHLMKKKGDDEELALPDELGANANGDTSPGKDGDFLNLSSPDD